MGLDELIGRTRAVVLRAIHEAPGSSTLELARSLGIATASASEHAKVLRSCGLVRTQRRGQSVAHVVTDLGRCLLTGTATGPWSNVVDGAKVAATSSS